MIPTYPLRVAFFEAVSGAEPVYDSVPAKAALPYYRLGPWTASSDLELELPTVDAFVQLDAFARDEREAHTMLADAAARLDGGVEGAWACTEELREVMEDPESVPTKRVYHGVSRWRVRA